MVHNYFDYIKKFKIYFYAKINENNEFVFPIKSDFINIKKKCVCDLIKHILKKINNKKIVIRINILYSKVLFKYKYKRFSQKNILYL